MPNRNLFKQILEATRDVWDRPGTKPSVRENFAAVLNCGTAALGWEIYASNHEEKRCYHRCRSRFCPSCGYRATMHWLAEMDASLPDIAYCGVVFTMPRELWSIFRENRHLLHDLPALGASVIQHWAKAKYNANVLIMVVTHTFGGDLKFNTHLHILVSAGGLVEADGRWLTRLVLEKHALMRAWRSAVINHLRSALRARVLKSNLSVGELTKVLHKDRYPKWITFLDGITSKAHFLRYAARYVRRPPIASWRLREVTDEEVEFVAKDTKAKQFVLKRVPLPQFIRLLAPHVPERYKNAIRYFGLLAPRSKGKLLDALFLQLRQTRKPRPRRVSWRESLINCFNTDPLIDSRGQEMHWVNQLYRNVPQ
jgi:Putative transposase/Transposase zinc-binding domain